MLVQDVRNEKGWRQQQLADAINLTRTSISNIESGRQAMTVDLFCAIAQALDRDPSKLLHEALNMTTPSAQEEQTMERVVNLAVNKVDSDIRDHILKTLK